MPDSRLNGLMRSLQGTLTPVAPGQTDRDALRAFIEHKDESAFAAILRIPFAILIPLIVFVCAIGAYAVANSMLDVWYMLGFGLVGYVFKKLDYPLAPLVLALVLGDLAENALRQSLIMSQGSPLILFERPISGVISAVAVFFFALPVLQAYLRRARKPEIAAVPSHDG